MKVLGVDTASDRKDRGYAIADSGQLVWYGSEPPPREAGPIDIVAGERPWQKKKAYTAGRWARTGEAKEGGLSGENLITFCVNNGFQLRDAWPFDLVPIFLLMPVSTWKDLALPGCAGYPGDVFCANFRQKYAPHVNNHNQLDAMGIALAASRIPPDQRKKFVPKGFLRA
jgi:hypothetical protein